MSQQFPQELIDIFLDYLSEDIGSLKNCSLVCHAWVFASRRHLFKRITLDLSCVFNISGDINSGLERFKLLGGVFEKTPPLAVYVEAFTLSASQLSLQGQHAALDPILSLIVENLRNVKTFTLCDVRWLGGFSRLTFSILSMLALPSIRSISFRHFTSSAPGLEPPKLLMLAPGLRGIHLEDVNPPWVDLPLAPFPNPTPIQSLSLSNHSSLAQFGWMLDARSPLDLCKLRELCLGSWVTRMDSLFVERLLRTTGGSLTHLELGRPPCIDHARFIHVDLVPNLRSLSISDAEFGSVFSWIYTLVFQSSPSHPLESIRITFSPSAGDPWSHDSCMWALGILLTMPGPAQLKKVHFCFPKNVWDDMGPERFRKQFHQLASRGLLYVDIF